MLITAWFVTLGAVTLAVALWIRFQAVWLVLLTANAIIQGWLTYHWQCNSVGWQAAYERDIQQCQSLLRLRQGARQEILLPSLQTCSVDQSFAELIPFDLRMPESRDVGTPALGGAIAADFRYKSHTERHPNTENSACQQFELTAE